jgi:hypothetical protein
MTLFNVQIETNGMQVGPMLIFSVVALLSFKKRIWSLQLQLPSNMYKKFTKCISFSCTMAVYSEEMLLAKEVHLLYNHLTYKDRLIKI